MSDAVPSKTKLPFEGIDRVWLWKDGHHYTQVATEKPPPHLPAAEFVRADYTWKQLQRQATGDDGVDIEVMVKRQAKRIADLERENARLQREVREAAKDATTEERWKHTQGEDYGTY